MNLLLLHHASRKCLTINPHTYMPFLQDCDPDDVQQVRHYTRHGIGVAKIEKCFISSVKWGTKLETHSTSPGILIAVQSQDMEG